jgi:hypothetical protein
MLAMFGFGIVELILLAIVMAIVVAVVLASGGKRK